MVLYDLSLSLLEEQIQGRYPMFLQSWYSDEFIAVVTGAHIKPVISHIEALGPACVFFLKQDKLNFVKAPGYQWRR